MYEQGFKGELLKKIAIIFDNQKNTLDKLIKKSINLDNKLYRVK